MTSRREELGGSAGRSSLPKEAADSERPPRLSLGAPSGTIAPVKPSEASHLLSDLHAGLTSRNRDYEGFQEPEARRVLAGYRRLKSLARELRRADVEVRVQRARQSDEAAVEVRVRGLRYHRLVCLSLQELDFLRTHMGADALPAVSS